MCTCGCATVARGLATHWTFGCDAADPHRIAAFRVTALGYVAELGFDGRTALSSLTRTVRGRSSAFCGASREATDEQPLPALYSLIRGDFGGNFHRTTVGTGARDSGARAPCPYRRPP